MLAIEESLEPFCCIDRRDRRVRLQDFSSCPLFSLSVLLFLLSPVVAEAFLDGTASSTSQFRPILNKPSLSWNFDHNDVKPVRNCEKLQEGSRIRLGQVYLLHICFLFIILSTIYRVISFSQELWPIDFSLCLTKISIVNPMLAGVFCILCTGPFGEGNHTLEL
jgi:hypothetical protein